jgi:hypothetical protein
MKSCVREYQLEPHGYDKTGVLTVTTGHAVAWLVDALSYKPEDRGFDSQ